MRLAIVAQFKGMARFRLNSSHGSRSDVGSWKDSSGFWFLFGSCTILLSGARGLLQGRPLQLPMGWGVVRTILVSVKFLSAILGPEMAAPILWTPRISVVFLQENLHVHKIPRFRGGVFWVLGGGSANFFYGRGDFSEVGKELTKSWPTFEQLCVQNLAWAISYCFLLPMFSPTKSLYKIWLARS